MRFIVSFVVLCLFFLPKTAAAQSYTSTSSSLTYTYNGSAYAALMQSEWYYSTSQSGALMWSGVSFDLTVSTFYSYEYYLAGSAISTNLTNYPCYSGDWSVGIYSPGVARVYGLRTVTLTQGYFYVLTMQPKASGSFQATRYGVWNPFVWPGQSQNLLLDLTHP